MRKKIGRMLSVLLASATFLSGSYIPVSASSPFTTTATSGTDKSSSKEATASTTDDSSGTAKTNLNAMTLSSDTEEVVSSSGSDDNTGSVVVDSATISTFDDRFDKKTYPLAKAPSKEKVIAELPETLSVTTTDGDQVSVPVQSWDSDDYKNSAIGDYTFTPALSDAYQYSLASSIPWIDVSVTKNKVTDISTSFEDEMCALADAPEVDVIKEDLPTELEATVNDENSTIKILSWDTDYDCTRAGVYTFTPVINEEIYELDGTSIPYEVITVYADESNGISLAVEGKVTSIGAFVAQVASGATKQANGDYVWTAPNDSKGHQFVFRINYSTSGQGTVSGNLDGSNSAWKITIPKTILKDKGGSRADTCELSIPSRDELSDFSEQEMKEAIGFAYYEDGGNLVIYNFRDLDAAQNGYIEVAYVTSDRTYNYLDYGATGAASSPFYATMQVSGLSATTEKIPVYINTTASVNATYKYYPVQSSAWRSTWGEKPSDADDYVWQRWEIRTDITDDPTQTYDFILTDEVTCNEVPVEVYGYQFSGSSSISETNKVSNIRSYDGYRYDYVFTRVKKTDRDKVTSYTLHNKITATVHPVDGVDADTNAVSTRDFSWTLPVFIHPNGHFYTWKYGNENWTNLFGSWYGTEWDYASYDLDKFQESKITSLDNIKYAIWAYGFPFPWTLKDGGSSDNWQDYGYKNVTYQVTDEAFYNLNSDGTYGADSQKFNPDYTNGWESEVAPGEDGSPLTPRMDPEDYDISYISLAAYFRDVPRDSEGHLSEDAGSIDENLEFNIQTISPTSKDVLELYTKSGTGDYVKAGELNLGTGKYTIVQDGLIKSITRDSYYRGSRGDWRINFKDGVDGFRVKTSNNHYYTDLKIYPYISIKNTERMLNWTGTGNITSTSSTAKDAVLVRNVSNLQVFDSSNNTILDLTKTAGDRLRRTEKPLRFPRRLPA